ncbi:CAP domain-containing protein [Streptomyces glomeratus]|uniref:SCP domain-containing protein n=1 Tax=Streptomyces glomeratus TaxID=284452 RepID=A0ABP6LJT5_9ACTN|nr:CAP domain-containing protein [Streptomyces glomeratus]MCF1508674.1 CAP domain-containing protein [Streptomyces glomeratus]
MSVPRHLVTILAGAVASAALPATPASAAAGPASMRSEVIRLTNAQRIQAGCPALTSDTALTKAAQSHTADMADHDFVDHTGSDGSSLVDRAQAAGYTGWSALAENVAAGQTTAADVVNSWMNSPGHRANILNCSLKQIGVGYVTKPGSTHGTYWTQDFGAKF